MPATSSSVPWPKACWYVACAAHEIAEKPLGRQICSERLVFFRDLSGRPVALEDFCPHRGAPLSMGVVRAGVLVCGYHGLAIGCEGRPAAMTGQDVSRFRSVRSFPVAEHAGFIWVWIGDPAAADLATLPSLPWADHPDWAYGGGLFHIRCDYRLMIDNLMDLTHETYVHAGSIGQREIDEAPVETALDGEEVVTRRFMSAVSAPPFWKLAMRLAGLPEDALVDRWQVCRFSVPSHVMIEVGVAIAGSGGYGANPESKASSIVVDFMTPETETSHWYFWGMARNFAPRDPEVTERIKEGQRTIFSEDLEMLERQQENLLHHPDHRLMRLNIDAGGALSRRQIDRAIAAESGL